MGNNSGDKETRSGDKERELQMATTNSDSAVSPEDGGAQVSQNQTAGVAQTGVLGETGSDVISGVELRGDDESSGRDPATDPDVNPIQGGDISETPAAQSGTRGGGTGADMGTGGEVGTTRPGQVSGS